MGTFQRSRSFSKNIFFILIAFLEETPVTSCDSQRAAFTYPFSSNGLHCPLLYSESAQSGGCRPFRSVLLIRTIFGCTTQSAHLLDAALQSLHPLIPAHTHSLTALRRFVRTLPRCPVLKRSDRRSERCWSFQLVRAAISISIYFRIVSSAPGIAPLFFQVIRRPRSLKAAIAHFLFYRSALTSCTQFARRKFSLRRRSH